MLLEGEKCHHTAMLSPLVEIARTARTPDDEDDDSDLFINPSLARGLASGPPSVRLY